MEAYNRRLEHQYEVAAFTAANIMSVWTKRPVRPSRLFRRGRSASKMVDVTNFKNSDELEKYLASKRGEAA